MAGTEGATLAGLMGWPARQSVSPMMHTHWLKELGIPGAYVALPTRPEDFSRVVDALPRAGFVGVNVTVPHKEAAFALCSAVDDAAREAGAVNTLVFQDGKISGQNTDIAGFSASLLEAFGPDAAKKPAVILGAGGAARAVIVALGKLNCPEIRIVNRTESRAEALAKHFAGHNVKSARWGAWDQSFADAGLLVNTASFGMLGKDEVDIPLDALPKNSCVMDIVYNPLETRLMQAARARGHKTEGGLAMLMHQAVPAFHAWFGKSPKVTPGLRGLLEKALA